MDVPRGEYRWRNKMIRLKPVLRSLLCRTGALGIGDKKANKVHWSRILSATLELNLAASITNLSWVPWEI
jgi:hypothetical protein